MKKYNAPQMNAIEVNPAVTGICGRYVTPYCGSAVVSY